MLVVTYSKLANTLVDCWVNTLVTNVAFAIERFDAVTAQQCQIKARSCGVYLAKTLAAPASLFQDR